VAHKELASFATDKLNADVKMDMKITDALVALILTNVAHIHVITQQFAKISPVVTLANAHLYSLVMLIVILVVTNQTFVTTVTKIVRIRQLASLSVEFLNVEIVAMIQPFAA